MPNLTRQIAVAVGYIFVVLSVLALLFSTGYGVWRTVERYQIVQHGHITDGIFIQYRGGAGRSRSVSEYRFIADGLVEDWTYGEDSSYFQADSLKPGTRIKVTYLPSDPKKNLLGDKRGSSIFRLMAMEFPSFILLVFVIVMLLKHLRLHYFKKHVTSRIPPNQFTDFFRRKTKRNHTV